MAGELLHDNNPALQRMVGSFGNSLKVATVTELGEREILFVEDGNHGENRPRQEEFEATGIAFLRPPDLKDGRVDFHNCGRINEAGFQRVRKGIGKRGDIILTHRATVGRIAITGADAPEVFVTNPGTTIWRSTSSEALNQRYLYCFMRSAAFMDQLWSQVGNNSTFDYVSLTQQRGLLVAYPPLPEQRAIAHILGTLDDKIELNRRMNETLEAMARALFKSWFVDFDPVRAKAEDRDPGLPQPLADLFPARLVDSELGEIPEGWEVKSLDRVADFQNGLALQNFRPAEGEPRLPVIKIAQLRSSHADSGEWASADIKTACIIDDGDLVFSWSGSLLVRIWCGGRGALNQHLFKVTSDTYPNWFCLHVLLTHLPEFRRIAAGKATTMGHIKRHHLSEALCVVPGDDLLVQAGELFSNVLDRQVRNDSSSRPLDAIRDALLPKLISGELRVQDAKRFIRRVT